MEIKCDECKVSIGTTDSVAVSAQGVICHACRRDITKRIERVIALTLRRELGVVVEVTARAADGWTLNGRPCAVEKAAEYLTRTHLMAVESSLVDDELDGEMFAYLTSAKGA